jgi:hypothetical protein
MTAPTFEEFVASRGRDLWRTAWLLTGDAHKAEDLVQTALMKCWRRWSSIAADGAAEPYVRRTMVTTPTGGAAGGTANGPLRSCPTSCITTPTGAIARTP